MTLGIPLEGALLDGELLSRAEQESLSHLNFLDLLLGAQADARRERSVARRIREAHFAGHQDLEGFHWQLQSPRPSTACKSKNWPRAISSMLRNNLILVGWSGVGKSHIIQALGQKACVAGYRVLYRTSAELLSGPHRFARRQNPSHASALLRASGSFGSSTNLGSTGIERTECVHRRPTCSYKIIASRNQKRSTALVTNVDFDKWGDYMADGPLAMAFLDRLVEGAIILKVTGKT